MNSRDALNRGYNLLVVSVLTLGGLAFGSVILNEADFNDKIDDIALLSAGILALIYYFVGRNRFSHSLIPVGLAALALAGQIVGVIIEKDDKEAFGDNIGGMILYVPFFILALYQYWRVGKLLEELPA